MPLRSVLITGTGGRSVGAGILYALTRSVGAAECRTRWDVVAADADPYAFGLYRAQRREVLPVARDQRYLERLKEVIRKHGIVAILPGTEAETTLLTREADALAPVKVIGNRHPLMTLMNDKRQLATRLAELGVDTPACCAASRWREFADAHHFPVIVKPATATGGSRGVRIIVDAKTMESLCQGMNGQLENYLVQEYVGSKDSEFTVGVLTDKDGRLIDSIVMQRKLVGLSLLDNTVHDGREYAISTGYSQGFIVTNPRVQAYCEQLAISLGSRGPLNIQLRVDGQRIVVFEVHPRFSGTTPIRADSGFNEPDVLLRNLLDGETFGRLGHRTNLVALRAFEHVMVPFAEYEAAGGEVPHAQ